MRTNLYVRSKCSHRCVSLKEAPQEPVSILKHATRISTEQTSMRSKWWLKTVSETKNQPKDRSFRPDVPADIRPKTSVRPSKSWKNKHFGTDMPRGCPRKNFGLIFRSLQFPRVTSIGSLPPEPSENPADPPQNPAETPQNPRRDPAEPSQRPPQSPLRGQFPRRASRRVVPLGWWPSGILKSHQPRNHPHHHFGS